MKLVYVPSGEVRNRERFPDGYWHATTDDGSNDGSGRDPLAAVSDMVAQIERERAQTRRAKP